MSALDPAARKVNLLEASRELAREAGEEGVDEGRPPRVGDLYLLRSTADFPVHWLLLEELAPGSFLAAAADTHPSSGPGDLTVATPLGPLRLRGRVTVEVRREALEAALYAGALAETERERARRALAGLSDSGEPAVGGEGSLSTELEDWLADVLHPARDLVQEEREMPSTAPAARRRSWRPARGLALAAALFLACLGLLAWSAFQQRRIGQLSSRLAALEAAPRAAGVPAEVVPNFPMAPLYSESLRSGAGDFFAWPVEAPFFALKLAQSEVYPSYQVVVEKAAGGEVLKQDHLRLMGGNAVQLAVPRHLFSTGSYRISLYGLRSGKADLVGRYVLDLLVE